MMAKQTQEERRIAHNKAQREHQKKKDQAAQATLTRRRQQSNASYHRCKQKMAPTSPPRRTNRQDDQPSPVNTPYNINVLAQNFASRLFDSDDASMDIDFDLGAFKELSLSSKKEFIAQHEASKNRKRHCEDGFIQSTIDMWQAANIKGQAHLEHSRNEDKRISKRAALWGLAPKKKKVGATATATAIATAGVGFSPVKHTADDGPSGKTNDAPASSSTTTSGWGDLLVADQNTLWKCEACRVQNKESDKQCVSCETARPSTASNVAAGAQGQNTTLMRDNSSMIKLVDNAMHSACSEIKKEALWKLSNMCTTGSDDHVKCLVQQRGMEPIADVLGTKNADATILTAALKGNLAFRGRLARGN
jgi:hypothetical protein